MIVAVVCSAKQLLLIWHSAFLFLIVALTLLFLLFLSLFLSMLLCPVPSPWLTGLICPSHSPFSVFALLSSTLLLLYRQKNLLI